MQSAIPPPDGGDSDNDEGFVVNPIEIKHKQTSKITVSNSKPNDYQPRFINGSCLLRKEMPNLVNTYPHFAKEEPMTNSKLMDRRQRQIDWKIEQQTFPNKNYQLFYQRFTKNNEFGSINTQNNVSLASIVSYSAENYSILKNWEFNKSNNQDLTFQSRFQCGNLHSAYKSLVKQNNYILFIQNDTNTKGYNKWFYFSVRNKKKDQTYTFSIVNFRKYFDFMKEGMKVTRFSQKEHEVNGSGWSKCGSNIHMYRSKLQNLNEASFNQNYTLTFEITFQYENDINFFSLLPPYSYTRLMNFLIQQKKSSKLRENLRFQYSTISYSISNTQVPYIVISGKEQSRKNIVILARQHPGEVWSSFFCQAVIKELLRDQFPQKQWLLKQYTFRILPMINVDGVIYGNFRCDLTGMDLNRCWKQPNKLLHPHLTAIKQEIIRLSKEEQIVCCLDLHSHSKQHNIFAYCCKTDTQARMLPLLISRISNLFYFPSCTYGVSKYKEATARAVVYDITKAPDVLTIQSSFYSANNPFRAINPSTYINFSNALLKALKYYYHQGKEYLQAEQALPKVMSDLAIMRTKNKSKYELDEQSGSDSEPECDQIALTQKLGKILPKCNVVEVALGLATEQKKKKQKNMPNIKEEKPKKLQKGYKTSDLRLQNISKPKIIEQSLTNKKIENSPLSITKPSFTNKNSINGRLNRLKKKSISQSLPKTIELRSELDQKIKYNIKPTHNESLQLNARKTSNLQKFLTNQFHSTFRQKQFSKYQIEYKYQKKQEEDFPLLCVLSQRKKQAHLQKIKRIHPPQPQKDKPIVRYQPTLIINKKLDTMQKLRQRQKNSSDLVSALWKETLGYDIDGPSIRIFN